jgi:hypothetical protein
MRNQTDLPALLGDGMDASLLPEGERTEKGEIN